MNREIGHCLMATLMIGSVCISSVVFAEAPTEYEKRMYRIFKRSAPVSRERWAEMVGERKQETYTVQKGDTLWDISQTLFGDGFFWSKLWAENGGLENPHQISPGQQIKLMSGNEANAPEISLGGEGQGQPIAAGADFSSIASDKQIMRTPKTAAPAYRDEVMRELTPEDVESSAAIEIDEIVPPPELPPARGSRKVLKSLPSSFITQKPIFLNNYDGTGLDAKSSRALTIAAKVIPNSFLADQPVENVGKVVEIEAQEKVASFGQNVFIRLKDRAQTGERFSILEPRGKIKLASGREIGPVVDINGRVQIIGVVDESRDIYRASVIQALNPIVLGALVSKMELPRATYSRSGTRTTIEANIIGAEYDRDRKLLGEGAVVYLDKGRETGFNVGDIVPIQSRRRERHPNTAFPDWKHAIGLIKIVKLEDTVATGIVLEAQEEILIGDRTGGKLTPNNYIHEEPVDPKIE